MTNPLTRIVHSWRALDALFKLRWAIKNENYVLAKAEWDHLIKALYGATLGERLKLWQEANDVNMNGRG